MFLGNAVEIRDSARCCKFLPVAETGKKKMQLSHWQSIPAGKAHRPAQVRKPAFVSSTGLVHGTWTKWQKLNLMAGNAFLCGVPLRFFHPETFFRTGFRSVLSSSSLCRRSNRVLKRKQFNPKKNRDEKTIDLQCSGSYNEPRICFMFRR